MDNSNLEKFKETMRRYFSPVRVYQIDSKQFNDKIKDLKDKGYHICDLTYTLSSNSYFSTKMRILDGGVTIEYEDDDTIHKVVFIRPYNPPQEIPY